MNGYVKNVGKIPQYIMKRNVLSGDIISVEDIEDRYLEVSGAKSAKQLVAWLRKFVFEGATWEVNITDVKKTSVVPEADTKSTAKLDKVSKDGRDSKTVSPNVGAVSPKVTAKDLVKVSYKKCAELAAKCSDARVIKEALQKANTMPRKEKVCSILRDRLAELS